MTEEIIEEMRKKIEEYASKSQNVLREIIRKSRETRSVFVEGLGEIKFGPLTIGDLAEIGKYKTREEQVVAILYCMLKRADPELTLEDVKSLPLDIATKILTAIGREIGFLTPT